MKFRALVLIFISSCASQALYSRYELRNETDSDLKIYCYSKGGNLENSFSILQNDSRTSSRFSLSEGRELFPQPWINSNADSIVLVFDNERWLLKNELLRLDNYSVTEIDKNNVVEYFEITNQDYQSAKLL